MDNAAEVLVIADRYDVGTFLGVRTLGTDIDDRAGPLPREFITRRPGPSTC